MDTIKQKQIIKSTVSLFLAIQDAGGSCSYSGLNPWVVPDYWHKAMAKPLEQLMYLSEEYKNEKI